MIPFAIGFFCGALAVVVLIAVIRMALQDRERSENNGE